MKQKSILVGKSILKKEKHTVGGGYVDFQGEQFYKISHYNLMPPFFMSIVSSSDHWMFISSTGGLTAGRKNPDNALFPYSTDDRIHDSRDQTGSKTILFVAKQGKIFLWEPFSQNYENIYSIERNLYKNIYGNKIIFEEINHDLALTFRYAWLNSEKFGFIKNSQLLNHNKSSVQIDILDGMQNLLPSGINRRFQMEYSTLVDGYKKNELQTDTGIGLFTLSSIPVDRAEPSEALKATTVWSVGCRKTKILISSRQLDAFRIGLPIKQETDIRASRGAYYMNTKFSLDKGQEKEWFIVAELSQDSSKVAALTELVKHGKKIPQQIKNDVAEGTNNLIKIVASADGLQATQDVLSGSRHFSNTLFNVMRGGFFDNGYLVEREDFISFIKTTNKDIAAKHGEFLKNLPDRFLHSELLSHAAVIGYFYGYGAGEGTLTLPIIKFLKNKVALTTYCIEPSELMDVLKMKCGPKVIYIKNGMEETTLPNSDFILMAHSSNYIKNKPEFAKRLYSSLNKGGKILIIGTKSDSDDMKLRRGLRSSE